LLSFSDQTEDDPSHDQVDHQTRLRTALALAFFVVVLIVSLLLIVGFHDAATSGIGTITAMISATGTVSTVVFAWRADHRSAKESDAATDSGTGIEAEGVPATFFSHI
jgi:hypothetical protein